MCPGENFCCRASVLFVLNLIVLINFFLLLAPQYKCYRDADDTPKCSPPATTDPPTVGNTNLPNVVTALEDSGATPTGALGGNSGVPGAGGTEVSSPPFTGGPTTSNTLSTPVGTIVGSVIGSVAGTSVLVVVVYLFMVRRSRGGQAHYLERPGSGGALTDDVLSGFGLSGFVCLISENVEG